MATSAQNARYYQKHKNRLRKNLAKWKSDNKAKCLSYSRKWNQSHQKIRSADFRMWRLANLAARAASVAAYRAARKRAIPAWTNLDEIVEIYRLASASGLHVDHIVPLNHPLVCGLHTRNNLQLLTKSENSSKKNFYWPDMPTKAQRQP